MVGKLPRELVSASSDPGATLPLSWLRSCCCHCCPQNMLSLPISLHLLRLNQNLIWGYSSSKEEWEINYILFFISSWKDSIRNGHPLVCPHVHVSTCLLGDAPALCFDIWRYLACIVLCMLWVKDLIFFFFPMRRAIFFCRCLMNHSYFFIDFLMIFFSVFHLLDHLSLYQCYITLIPLTLCFKRILTLLPYTS